MPVFNPSLPMPQQPSLNASPSPAMPLSPSTPSTPTGSGSQSLFGLHPHVIPHAMKALSSPEGMKVAQSMLQGFSGLQKSLKYHVNNYKKAQQK